VGSHPVESDSWHHIAVSFDFDQSAVRFYVNGQEDRNFERPTVHPKSEDYNGKLELVIGGDSTKGHLFTGHMDDVSIWDRPLSSKHGKSIVWDTMAGHEQGLVGYWSFNHNWGEFKDVAGNSQDGVAFGNVALVEMSTKPLVTTTPCL